MRPLGVKRPKPKSVVDSLRDAPPTSLTLLIKLGSIAVHADELISLDGREADKQAILGLLQDAEVSAWIKSMGVYMPVKRRKDNP